MTKQAELRDLLEQVVESGPEAAMLQARALSRCAGHFSPDQWDDLCCSLVGDMNAALAFRERVLPGWDYEVGSCGPHMVGDRAAVWDDHPEDGGDPRRAECPHAANAALALVAAVLKALIEQESE